jgi:hypothetical protein
MVAQSAILDRLIEPQRGGFSPEHARYVLSLDFSPGEHAQYAALSEKAQAGTLTDQERADLDDFLAVNALLTILQAKARTSLKKHVPAA